jgi:hypothetical protein
VNLARTTLSENAEETAPDADFELLKIDYRCYAERHDTSLITKSVPRSFPGIVGNCGRPLRDGSPRHFSATSRVPLNTAIDRECPV